jgi:hypothetical protein
LLAVDDMFTAGNVRIPATAAVIARVASDQPLLRVSIVYYIRKSRVLRDSALCVAHRLLSSYFTSRERYLSGKLHVLKHLLCAAYARTVEQIAVAIGKTTEQRLMFVANSDTNMAQTRGLAESVEALGLTRAFLLGVIAHLRLSINSPWLDRDARRLTAVWKTLGFTSSETEEALVVRVLTEAFGAVDDVEIGGNIHYFQYANCEEEYGLLCLPDGVLWLKNLDWIFDATNELISATLSA